MTSCVNRMCYTKAQALVEANRCLHCYQAPCQRGCPADIDVPTFIRRVATEDFVGAAETIRTDNPLGAVCARVCPSEQLCKKACSQKALSDAIEISGLQAFALDAAKLKAAAPAVSKGKKVAVVGAGPGGLAAAHYLSGQGYAVTLFEKTGEAGGIPLSQIPDFRLDSQAMKDDLQAILHPGIQLVQQEVGAKQAESILAEYDAVYLSAGLGAPVAAIPMDVAGCRYAEDFLEDCKAGRITAAALGTSVVVMGGGNTAMDAACAARTLGAPKVTVLYRRTSAEMPAWEREFTHAIAMGVEFGWRTQVLEVKQADGAVAAVRYAPTAPNGKDEAGRDIMRPIAGREMEMEATTVISALGRKANSLIAQAFGLQTGKNGQVAVDANLATSNPKVFAGGDFVNGGDTVVQAVADGKKAALVIAATLEG